MCCCVAAALAIMLVHCLKLVLAPVHVCVCAFVNDLAVLCGVHCFSFSCFVAVMSDSL